MGKSNSRPTLSVLVNCSLFEIGALTLAFDECASPYFVKLR
jgi:hypothetical protein